MVEQTLTSLRADFDHQAGSSTALPVAGAAVWVGVGIAALFLGERTAALVLAFATGAIFPLALGLSQLLGEKILSNTNPLARLMGLCTLMVNLLWAVHITVLIRAPEFLPLSLGIGLGLHWVVFSWIIQHRLGVVHALLRTVLVTGLWWLFPTDRVSAVAAGVVIAYGYAIYALRTRVPNTVSTTRS